MFWLFYSSENSEISRAIAAGLREAMGPKEIETQYGIKKFDHYISHPHTIITHAFLFVSGKEDLIALEQYQEQISDWRTIIGIPGGKKRQMMSKALGFHPRFIALLPEETDQLIIVIEKMIQNERKKPCLVPVKKGKTSQNHSFRRDRKTSVFHKSPAGTAIGTKRGNPKRRARG